MKCLITGSSSGIGQELVNNLLDKGHKIIAVARDHKKFQANNIVINKDHYITYKADLAILDQVTNLAKLLNQQHPDIDILIINAGYGDFKELEQFSEQQITNMFNVNVIAPILLVKQLLNNLKKGTNKKIIFIGSEAALTGSRKGTIYCATKFALRGFMQSLRQECQNKNIAVTMINPAMVKTNFYKKQSFTHGEAEENYIKTTDIAKIIDLVINLKNNLNLDEINVNAMKKVIKFNTKS